MEGLSFQDSSFEQNERSSSRTFVVVIAIVLLIGVAIFGATRLNLFQNFMKPSPTPTPFPTVMLTQKPSPTELPTETPAPSGKAKITPRPSPKATPTSAKLSPTGKATTGLDRSAVSIAVKNGSGKAGVAQAATDTLKELGYSIASTGNADNYDYQNVTIQIKSSKQNYLVQLKKDLSASYTVGSSSASLAESSSADAIVIIGQ